MRSLVFAALALTHALPHVDGSHLHVQVVDVTYAPGGSSKPHSHTCPATVYVVSGSVKSRVRGEPLRVYGPGATFYEAPNGMHDVSANASRTQRANFVAFFVCEGTNDR